MIVVVTRMYVPKGGSDDEYIHHWISSSQDFTRFEIADDLKLILIHGHLGASEDYYSALWPSAEEINDFTLKVLFFHPGSAHADHEQVLRRVAGGGRDWDLFAYSRSYGNGNNPALGFYEKLKAMNEDKDWKIPEDSLKKIESKCFKPAGIQIQLVHELLGALLQLRLTLEAVSDPMDILKNMKAVMERPIMATIFHMPRTSDSAYSLGMCLGIDGKGWRSSAATSATISKFQGLLSAGTTGDIPEVFVELSGWVHRLLEELEKQTTQGEGAPGE